jgi:hypothetical protein
MRQVFKYDLPADYEFSLVLPRGAELLHVAGQHDRPRLWALVDPEAGFETRRFRLAGTGHPIVEEKLKHVGSFMMNGDTFVFHLFEVL